MTPSDCIGAIDRQISLHGQPVSVVFVEMSGNTTLSTQAFVRAYRLDELAPGLGITQGDSLAIFSPTGLLAAPRIIRKNDRVNVDGRDRNIEAATPVKILDVVVRWNVQILGS